MILSGSWETGDEGWQNSNQYDSPAYRQTSVKRTGSYAYYVSYSSIGYVLPVEANNATITVSFWGACEYLPASNFHIGADLFHGVPPEDFSKRLSGTNTTVSGPGKTWRFFTHTFVTDGSYSQYYISITAMDDPTGGGYLDDWSISFEPNTSTFCKDGNVWKPSDKYVKENGIWKPANTTVKHSNAWKEV